MQSVSSKIWTRVAVSISYDVNHYTTGTSLSGTTNPDQSGPGSDGNKQVLCIPQISSITRTSPSDCLVSYPGHSLVGGLTPLHICSQCILQSQPTGQKSLFKFSQRLDDSF